ncbi:MAG: extracellular solute-binding protein [Clostridia bacterium]|nr:extracellular solute-binding protein [Clostridia bacterium]
MKRLKLLAVFAAVLLCLQSCGIIIINNVDGKETVTTAEDDTQEGTDTNEVKEIVVDKKTSDEMKKNADDTLQQLDALKYSGMRILVAATDTLFYEGDGSATPLTSDRVVRADKIKEKLDATVNVVSFSEEDLYNKLKAAVKKKEYFADVIAVPISLVGSLIADGLVKSLRTVPGLDLKADYFSADALNAFSAGHGTYALSGEGCFEPEKIYCIYFNKELAKQLGYDMYSLVSDGEWTLEKYVECAAAASSAGKGTAVVKENVKYERMLLSGSGFDFANSGMDKTPYANTFTEEYKNKVELLSTLQRPFRSDSPADTFTAGGVLFCIDTVFAAEEMADSSVVWGMLPFPKYNKDGEYGSYISDDAVVLCIPEYAADDRMSGDLIEALFASSTEYIKYDFLYHNMLDVLRDNGSVNSLNVIMNNPNYDFVIAMRSGYPTLYSNTAGAFSDLISKELTFEKYKEKEAEVTEYSEKWFPVMYK